jgi:hypothetical protein
MSISRHRLAVLALATFTFIVWSAPPGDTRPKNPIKDGKLNPGGNPMKPWLGRNLGLGNCTGGFATGMGFGVPAVGFGGSGGVQIDGCSGPFWLLTQTAVQRELALTPAQAGKIRDLSLRDRQSKQAIQRLPFKDQGKRYQELWKANEKAAQQVVNAGQWERVKQIDRQHRGGLAILDAESIEELKVTVEQQQKMQNAAAEVGNELLTIMPGFGVGGFNPQELQKKLAEVQQKMQEVTSRIQEKVYNVLTDEQKKHWEKMQGDPFPRPVRAK